MADTGDGAGVVQGYQGPRGPAAVTAQYMPRTCSLTTITLSVQVALSITALGLTIGLIATQPVGASSAQVNFIVFLIVYSLISWFYIFILAPRLEDYFGNVRIRAGITIGVGILGILFYLAGALALTVAIAPGGSCNDKAYLSSNTLLAGRSSRCHVVEADIAIVWVGKRLFHVVS